MPEKSVILTGSLESSLRLATNIAQYGFAVHTMPMIDIVAVPSQPSISAKILKIHAYNWMLFTSRYGVSKFFEYALKEIPNFSLPSTMQCACVGRKTAEELQKFGYTAQFVCSQNNAKDFAAEFSDFIGNNQIQVLFPTGNLTQNMIALSVPKTIQITKIIVYYTVPPTKVNQSILQKLASDEYTYIVFTSPSGVTNFVTTCGSHIEISQLRTVSIGPTTTARLQEYSVSHILQAQEYNSDGILTAMITHKTT